MLEARRLIWGQGKHEWPLFLLLRKRLFSWQRRDSERERKWKKASPDWEVILGAFMVIGDGRMLRVQYAKNMMTRGSFIHNKEIIKWRTWKNWEWSLTMGSLIMNIHISPHNQCFCTQEREKGEALKVESSGREGWMRKTSLKGISEPRLNWGLNRRRKRLTEQQSI